MASGHCLLLGETLPLQALQKVLGTPQLQVPGKDFPAALKASPTQWEVMELSGEKENTHKAC